MYHLWLQLEVRVACFSCDCGRWFADGEGADYSSCFWMLCVCSMHQAEIVQICSVHVVLTHDCLSMWLVISFVLLISVYLLIWFSCSLVNFGKSNFFAVSYLVLKFSDSNNLLSFFLLDYIIDSNNPLSFFYLTTSLSQSIFIVFGLYCHLCHDFASSWDNAAISSSFSSFHHKYYPLINIWQCAVFMLGWNGTRNKQREKRLEIWRQMLEFFCYFFSGALHLIQDENMNVTC